MLLNLSPLSSVCELELCAMFIFIFASPSVLLIRSYFHSLIIWLVHSAFSHIFFSNKFV